MSGGGHSRRLRSRGSSRQLERPGSLAVFSQNARPWQSRTSAVGDLTLANLSPKTQAIRAAARRKAGNPAAIPLPFQPRQSFRRSPGAVLGRAARRGTLECLQARGSGRDPALAPFGPGLRARETGFLTPPLRGSNGRRRKRQHPPAKSALSEESSQRPSPRAQDSSASAPGKERWTPRPGQQIPRTKPVTPPGGQPPEGNASARLWAWTP